jgi:hypothetical protein
MVGMLGKGKVVEECSDTRPHGITRSSTADKRQAW